MSIIAKKKEEDLACEATHKSKETTNSFGNKTRRVSVIYVKMTVRVRRNKEAKNKQRGSAAEAGGAQPIHPHAGHEETKITARELA